VEGVKNNLLLTRGVKDVKNNFFSHEAWRA
jgi:hypothetical protein